jgi:hypothetical protein
MASSGREGTEWYRAFSKKALRQGDVALTHFHQLRMRGGEPAGPGDASYANQSIPYLGPFQDFEVELPLPGMDKTASRILRVWAGYVIIIHQSCEIEYADEADSRVTVAPLVSHEQWSSGPWELIRQGQLPGFMRLPHLTEEEANEIGCPGALPEMCVAFGSTTLLSRALIKSARVASLRQERLSDLQAGLVRFFTVRGWASGRELDNLIGKTVVEAVETVETVPGPSRLAKVILRGDSQDADDEVAVTWGLRPTKSAKG